MSYGPKQTLKEGYEKFVIKNPDGCWDWSGCYNEKNKSVQFWSDGKTQRGHLISWKIYNGEIPSGMKVKRSCNNPRCTNPEHLYLSKHEKPEGRNPNTLKSGFEKHVIRKKGCWDWDGSFYSVMGYGRFNFNKKMISAHRASWIIHYGDIPNGLCVCHKCDNPRCSNPEHLFLGTTQENNEDMMNKDRNPILNKKGEENFCSKLTNENVVEIKKLLNTEFTQRRIAKKFNVERSTISNIKRKVSWKHLEVSP